LVGYDALRARLERVGHCDRKLMQMLLSQSEREAELLAPRRTGNLRRSIGSKVISDTKGQLYARAKYAEAHERGSGLYGPHHAKYEIKPKVKRALAFASQGMVTERFGDSAILKTRLTGSMTAGSMREFGNAALVVVRSVMHPGVKARPYMVPGAKAAIKGGGLEKEIVSVWEGK
jgi:hypothetical protein